MPGSVPLVLDTREPLWRHRPVPSCCASRPIQSARPFGSNGNRDGTDHPRRLLYSRDLTLSPAILPIVIGRNGRSGRVLAPDEFKYKRIVIDSCTTRSTFSPFAITSARVRVRNHPVRAFRCGTADFTQWSAACASKRSSTPGGQRTIGNLAMKDALIRHHAQGSPFRFLMSRPNLRPARLFRATIDSAPSRSRSTHHVR